MPQRNVPTGRQRRLPTYRGPGTGGIDAFTNVMANAAEQVSAHLDKVRMKEGQQEAIEAVQKGEFKEKGGVSLYEQAFNATGIQGYKAGLQNRVSESLNAIYKENKHDPKLLQEKMDEYERTIIGEVEQRSPQVALDLQNGIGRQRLGLMDRATAEAEAALITNTSAEVETTLDYITQQTMFQVRNMKDRAGAMVSAVQNRAAFERILLDNAAPQAFTEDDSMFLSESVREEAMKPNAERTGILDSKQIKAALKDFDNRIINEKYQWGMDESLKQGTGIEYLRQFAENPDPSLTPEQHDMVLKNMYANMAEYSKRYSALGQAEKDAQEALWARTEREQTALLLNGEADPSIYGDLVDNGSMKPSTARTLAKEAGSGGPQRSNGIKLMEYQVMGVHNYSEMDIMTDAELTYDDRRKLIEERQDTIEDQYNWKNMPSGKQGAEDIRGELGIVGENFGLVDEEKAREVTRALNTYWNRVNNEPIEKRNDAAPRIALEIVNEIKAGNKRKELDRYRSKLEMLDYNSVEAVDAAVADGDEDLVSSFLGMDFVKEDAVKTRKEEITRLQTRINKLEAELNNGL